MTPTPTSPPQPDTDQPERRTIVYTVGHGARPFHEVAADLHRHGIGLVVDVRSVPASRYAPDFTKSRLQRLAAEHDLGYRWLGDRLGGRPDDPSLRSEGVTDWAAVAESDAFAAGMGELDGLIDASVVVLLCAELDPVRCHRATLIVPVLEERGIRTRHVLADGTAIDHQATLQF